MKKQMHHEIYDKGRFGMSTIEHFHGVFHFHCTAGALDSGSGRRNGSYRGGAFLFHQNFCLFATTCFYSAWPPYDLNHNLNYPSVFLGSFRLIMSFPFRVSVIEKSHRAIRSHHSSLSLLPREHTTQDQFTCSSQPQVCQRHASCSLDIRKEATRPAGRFNPKSAQT